MPRKSRKKVVYPFKFGRRDPKRAPALQFNRFWTGVIPTHPTAEDYASKLSAWQMLGNDQYGDCVAVAWANVIRLVTSFLSKEEYPDQQEVFDVYKTQNPNFPTDDNGMDIQTLLEYLHGTAGPDGRKLVAFAQVDVTNPDEVEAAQAIFGAPILGFNVQSHNMSEFDLGNTWTYDPSDSIAGGHAVLMGGYDTAMGYRFVTWAQETGMGLDFIKSPLMQEAWILIWPEHLGTQAFQQGVDLNALAADYLDLTGQVLPIPKPPAPPPVPVPPVPPTPTPSLWELILQFLKWLWSLLTGK